MSGSQKSRDDLAKFRRVSFRFVDAAPRKASKGVSDFASAKALLDVQPERHLKLTSALTIWPKFTSLPEPSLNPVSTSFSIEWVDHAYFKDHSIRGTLETVDAAAKDGLWQEWLDWLTIAGDAVELCKIPQGCSESLPLVPHPLNRWLYLVHEFVAPGLFTWGLTPSQLNDWQQRCNEAGFGEIYQSEVDSHGTRSHWLGAAAGERLRVEGLYSLQELPASFHVCSEIQNVIYESRKVLSVLEPKPIQPDGDGDGASDSQHETTDPVRPVVAESDDRRVSVERTASAPNTPQLKRPKQKSFESFKYQFVLNTQSDIAEAVYGDRSKQSKVSRDIATVETYLAACGLPKDEWKVESAKPEFTTWDSATIDLGKRQDGHTESQREKFEESD
jgi:hypothetical protein